MKAKTFFSLLVVFHIIFSFSQLSHAAEQRFTGAVEGHREAGMYFAYLLPTGEDNRIFLGATYELSDCITSAIESRGHLEIIGDFVSQDGSLSLNLGKKYSCNPVKQNNFYTNEPQNTDSTEVPLELNYYETDLLPKYPGTMILRQISIVSLTDVLTVKKIVLNRGRLQVKANYPFRLGYGEEDIRSIQGQGVVREIVVTTDQGAFIFNMK